MMARLIGAAPRQRGSSEACRLKQPSRGASRIGLRQDHAIGDDHGGIGLVRAKFLERSGVFSVFGVSTGMPSRSRLLLDRRRLQFHAARRPGFGARV